MEVGLVLPVERYELTQLGLVEIGDRPECHSVARPVLQVEAIPGLRAGCRGGQERRNERRVAGPSKCRLQARPRRTATLLIRGNSAERRSCAR